MNRKLPAYPLFVKDPMFSVWSRTDRPTDSETVFWTGQKKVLKALSKLTGRVIVFWVVCRVQRFCRRQMWRSVFLRRFILMRRQNLS